MEETLQLIRQDIQNTREEVRQSREESKTQLLVITNKLDNYVLRVQTLEKKFEDINKQNEIFYDQFDDIRGDLNSIKQKEISLNLIVKGMMERDAETEADLKSVVDQLMNIIGVEEVVSFKNIRRIGKKIVDKPRLILLQTADSSQKKMIIAKKRKHKITANQINIGGTPVGDTNTAIYIDEHLTPYTARLLSRCRQLRNEMNIKYVWTTNGIIYLRMDDNTQAVQIRNDFDVDLFVVNNATGRKRKAESEFVDNEARQSKQRKKQLSSGRRITRSQSLNTQYMEARAKFMRGDGGASTSSETTAMAGSTTETAIETVNGRGAAIRK